MRYVFDNEWFIQYQPILLWFLNAWGIKYIARHFFRINGAQSSVGTNDIVAIGPHYISWQVGPREIGSGFRTHNKFSKRLYYGLYPLWLCFHLWDMFIANVFFPQLNVGFDTLTVYPDANPETTSVDGYTYRGAGEEAFATIQAGAGSASDDSQAIGSLSVGFGTGPTTNLFNNLTRYHYLFDTSAIAASSFVLSATFSVFGSSKNAGLGNPTYHVVSTAPASNTSLAAADHGNMGTVSYGSIAHGSISTSGYNDFALNTYGLNNITKGGISKFGIRTDWDKDNSFGGAWAGNTYSGFAGYFADQTGNTNDPKLFVTYNVAHNLSILTNKIRPRAFAPGIAR